MTINEILSSHAAVPEIRDIPAILEELKKASDTPLRCPCCGKA